LEKLNQAARQFNLQPDLPSAHVTPAAYWTAPPFNIDGSSVSAVRQAPCRFPRPGLNPFFIFQVRPFLMVL
jgi:hypothetical protein